MTKGKEKPTNGADTSSSLFQDRDKMLGRGNKVNPLELDARLLWKVVNVLAERSASIQIGTTKDGGAWAVQYWDGKYPVKDYFNSTEELNRSFAALIIAAEGKTLEPEWREICQSYGWQ